MCQISKISDDWILKGFHLHIFGIELVMRPDHRGGIVFKKWFQSSDDKEVQTAIRRAKELLEDANWLRLFYREAIRGRTYLSRRSTSLAELARGRAGELTFLAAALRNLGIG